MDADPPLSDHTPSDPDDDRRRRALALYALSYFLSFGGLGIQVPLLSPSLATLGFSSVVIGGLWAARSVTGILAPTAWGAWADRIGDGRGLAGLCLLGSGASLAGLAAVQTELAALALFGLYGLCGAASVSLVDGLVLNALADQKARYGRIRLFGALGFGVFALAATELTSYAPPWAKPEAVFLSAGSLSALAAVLVWFAPAVARPRAPGLSFLVRTLRSARLGLLGLLAVLHWAGHGAYTAFITPLAQAVELNTAVVGWALAVSILLEVIAMRTADRARARIGVHGLLLIVTAVATLRWLGLAWTTSAWAFIALQALHGVTFGWFYPTVVTAIAERIPDEARQGAQGVFTSGTFGIGGALGMAIAGWTMARGAEWTWGMMAALNAGALGAALLLRRK